MDAGPWAGRPLRGGPLDAGSLPVPGRSATPPAPTPRETTASTSSPAGPSNQVSPSRTQAREVGEGERSAQGEQRLAETMHAPRPGRGGPTGGRQACRGGGPDRRKGDIGQQSLRLGGCGEQKVSTRTDAGSWKLLNRRRYPSCPMPRRRGPASHKLGVPSQQTGRPDVSRDDLRRLQCHQLSDALGPDRRRAGQAMIGSTSTETERKRAARTIDAQFARFVRERANPESAERDVRGRPSPAGAGARGGPD